MVLILTNHHKKNKDTVNFEKLVAQYLNWWINVPIEEDPQQVDNPCVYMR